MFRIKEVLLTNFRLYRGEHTWTLPTGPGLFFMTSRNTLNETLDRNDGGKSTLLDAINWCFYGSTLRGLKAGSVISWGESSCSVEIPVIIHDQTYVIKRVQNPNNLTINGKTATQTEVTNLLRIGQEAFGYSIVLPQFGDSFFDLSPAKKLTLFSEIMDLELWLEKSKNAADKTAFLAEQIISTQQKMAAAEAKYEAAGVDIANLTEKSENWQTEQYRKLKNTKDEIKTFQAEVKSLESQLKLIKKERERLSKELQALQKKIMISEANLKKVEKSYWDVRNQQTRLQTEHDAIRTTLSEIKEIASVCPTCHQKVDSKHLSREKSSLIEKLHNLEDKLTANKRLLKKSDAAMTETENALTADNKQLLIFNKQDIALDKEVNKCESELEYAHEAIEELQSTETPSNPYEELLELKTKALDDVSFVLADLNDSLEIAREEHAAVSYWVQGFKKLRLMIVEETLRTLEVEVNSTLASLGLADWSISFDVERENKSGGVTTGFVVLIHSPDNAETVPWTVWSGGLSNLLSLAGALGLSNLITQRAGLTNMIEFYDEPSTHTSAAGIQAIVTSLRERAHQSGKTIILIDHSSVDSGEFDGVITIIRDEQGSHIT